MKIIHALILVALTASFSIAQPSLTASPISGDPFAARSVWEGNRRFEKDNGKLKKGNQSWSLTVTERNGREFKGTITLESNLAGKNVTCDVAGNAPMEGDGPIHFKTERSGDFQQTFIGKIKNGAVTLDFQGKSAAGESVEGVAALTRKN